MAQKVFTDPELIRPPTQIQGLQNIDSQVSSGNPPTKGSVRQFLCAYRNDHLSQVRTVTMDSCAESGSTGLVVPPPRPLEWRHPPRPDLGCVRLERIPYLAKPVPNLGGVRLQEHERGGRTCAEFELQLSARRSAAGHDSAGSYQKQWWLEWIAGPKAAGGQGAAEGCSCS